MGQNVFIRALSVGELLDKAFHIYRAYFLKLIGITAIPMIPATLLIILSTIYVHDSRIATIVEGFISDIAIVALIPAISGAYLGRTLTIGQSYSSGLKRYLSVIGGSILIGMAILAPVLIIFFCLIFIPIIGPLLALLALLPAIPIMFFFGTRWAVYAICIVLENTGASNGLRRSWNLTSKYFWRVMGTSTASTILVYLIVLLPGLVIGYLLTALGLHSIESQALQQAATQILSVISLPFNIAVQVLIYYDLRIRVEGFDLSFATQQLIPETG
jgi:hypothetical protein